VADEEDRMKRPLGATSRSGPQTVLPCAVEVTDQDDAVTARAGLLLVAETVLALGLHDSFKRQVKVRERDSGYSEADKCAAQVLLFAAGGDCLDDLEVLRSDRGLCRLLGRGLPSPDAQRAFLYRFHDDQLIAEAKARRKPDQQAYIPEENEPLKGLGRANVELTRRVAAEGRCRKATLDHDASVIESHKREALPHYKGGRGYQPSVILWVEQDLALVDEWRDGNVPAGMENLPLIQRGFAALPSRVTEYYFRSDSACYDEKVLKWLADEEREEGPKGHIGFTISADMSPELRAKCQAVPEERWTLLEDRAEETVCWADVEFTPGVWPKKAEPLRYVALRMRKKQGLLFGGGFDAMYLAVVSNRWAMEGPELVRWHWEKAGTIEHLHDVIKNELGGGDPPCGRFGANAARFRLS
jgi:hypothetical protein